MAVTVEIGDLHAVAARDFAIEQVVRAPRLGLGRVAGAFIPFQTTHAIANHHDYFGPASCFQLADLGAARRLLRIDDVRGELVTAKVLEPATAADDVQL